MEVKLSDLSDYGKCHTNREKRLKLYTRKSVKQMRVSAMKQAIRLRLMDEATQDESLDSMDANFEDMPFLASRTKEVQKLAGKNEVTRFFRSVAGVKVYFPEEAPVDIGCGVVVDVKPDLVTVNGNTVSAVMLKDTKSRLSGKRSKTDLKLWALANYAKVWAAAFMPGKSVWCQGSYIYLRRKDDLNEGPLGSFSLSGGDEVSLTLQEKLPFELEEAVKAYAEGLAPDACDEKVCEFCKKRLACHYKHAPKALPKETDTVREISDIMLSPFQQAVVDAREGIFRVVAMAGSGKTTVIILRVCFMLLDGAAPEEILMITFTVEAAKEMKERLIAMWAVIGDGRDIEGIMIMTFNAFGQWLLQKPEVYEAEGLTAPPRIMDDGVKAPFLDAVLDAHPIAGLDMRNATMDMPYAKGDLIVARMVFDVIKEVQASRGDADKVLANMGDKKRHVTPEIVEKLIELYDVYEDEMRRQNYVDYNDQIVMAVHYMLKHPFFFDELGIRHMIIDEAQDTNAQQMEIVKNFIECSGHLSTMFVGDPDQAIYGFRGCDPSHMVHLSERLGVEVTDLPMRGNYRCSGNVISYANAIIAHNSDRIPGSMTAIREPGDPVTVQAFHNVTDEIDYTVKVVSELLKTRKASDIVILARTRASLKRYEEAFHEAGLPFRMENSERFADNSRCQAAIALAEAIKDGSTEGMYTYANAVMQVQGKSILDLTDAEAEAAVEGVKKQVRQYMRAYNEKYRKKLLADMLHAVDEDDEIYQAFMDSFMHKTCKEIIDFLYTFYEYCPKSEARREREYEETVTGSTVHNYKGLEKPVVFLSLSGFDRNAFHAYTLPDDVMKELEEARRLCYVGATRAKDTLYVTGVAKDYGCAGHLSTFMSEAYDAVGRSLVAENII